MTFKEVVLAIVTAPMMLLIIALSAIFPDPEDEEYDED